MNFNREGTLAGLDPRPLPGEWYTVKCAPEGTIRMVVLINTPHMMRFPHGSSSGIGHGYEPQKLNFQEAKNHLHQEIKDVENSIARAQSGKREDEVTVKYLKVCQKNMINFYQTHFDLLPPSTSEQLTPGYGKI